MLDQNFFVPIRNFTNTIPFSLTVYWSHDRVMWSFGSLSFNYFPKFFHINLNFTCFFTWIEVRAMVVAVQQPSAECTAVLSRVFANTAHLPSKNLHRSTVKRIWKQCTHPKSRVNALATHQTLWSLLTGQKLVQVQQIRQMLARKWLTSVTFRESIYIIYWRCIYMHICFHSMLSLPYHLISCCDGERLKQHKRFIQFSDSVVQEGMYTSKLKPWKKWSLWLYIVYL